MDKFKKDWKIATAGQKVLFYIITTLLLVFSGLGIYAAILFSLYKKSNNSHEAARYIILTLIAVVIVLILSKFSHDYLATDKLGKHNKKDH